MASSEDRKQEVIKRCHDILGIFEEELKIALEGEKPPPFFITQTRQALQEVTEGIITDLIGLRDFPDLKTTPSTKRWMKELAEFRAEESALRREQAAGCAIDHELTRNRRDTAAIVENLREANIRAKVAVQGGQVG